MQLRVQSPAELTTEVKVDHPADASRKGGRIIRFEKPERLIVAVHILTVAHGDEDHQYEHAEVHLEERDEPIETVNHSEHDVIHQYEPPDLRILGMPEVNKGDVSVDGAK